MMLRAVVPAILLTGCSAAPLLEPSTLAGGDDRHISLLLGGRVLHEESVERGGVDDQPVAELQLDHRDGSGWGWEYGVGRSQAYGHIDGFQVGSDFTELYAGWRKTFFEDEPAQPYLTLGGSAVHGDVDFGTGDDDDGWTFCPYVRLGMQWQFDDFRLGLDYRRAFGKFHFSGPNFNADYDQLALSFGFPF